MVPNAPKRFRLPGRATPMPQPARESSYQRGYARWDWVNYSRKYRKEHPKCCRCGADSEHVDHIKPVKDRNDPLFWDPTNHQPLCRPCHSRKTAAEDGGFGNARKLH